MIKDMSPVTFHFLLCALCLETLEIGEMSEHKALKPKVIRESCPLVTRLRIGNMRVTRYREMYY